MTIEIPVSPSTSTAETTTTELGSVTSAEVRSQMKQELLQGLRAKTPTSRLARVRTAEGRVGFAGASAGSAASSVAASPRSSTAGKSLKRLTDSVPAELRSKSATQPSLALVTAERQKTFRILVRAQCVYTPIAVSQPRAQLIQANRGAMLDNTIYIPQYSRAGRMLVTNISSRPVKFDLKILRPEETLTEEMAANQLEALSRRNCASRCLIASPLTAVVDPGCQCAVSMCWEDAVPEKTRLSLYLFCEYRDAGSKDLMRVLAWKGLAQCVGE